MFRFFLLVALLAVSITPVTAQQNGNRTAVIRNNSQQTIVEIYSSPTTSNDWGLNRLTGPIDHLGVHRTGTLRRGDPYQITYHDTPNCIFDFKVVYADGTTDVQRLVNICKGNVVSFRGLTH